MLKKIRISDIIVSDRKRRINLQKVNEIAESIKTVGLINFITVTSNNELVAGNHRLEAMKLLSYDEIEVNEIDVEDIDKELIEIDENLIRSELTKLEHADQLLRRKQIYEIKFPETKQGIAQALATNKKKKEQNVNADHALTEENETPVKSFVKDTAEKTGISERTIHEEIQIAKNISDESKEVIKDTDISNKKTKLLELAKTPEKEQLAKALSMISGELKANKTFKNVVKKQNDITELKEEERIDNLLLKLEKEIAEQNENAISTYKEIINISEQKKDLLKVINKFSPFILEIAITNYSLSKTEFIVELGYNPFLLPELIENKKSVIINELEECLKGWIDEEYTFAISKIEMILKLFNEDKFTEVCLHLFEVKIELNRDIF